MTEGWPSESTAQTSVRPSRLLVNGLITASGIKVTFGLGEFTPAQVRADDIAAHLGQIGRFGGAGRRFYPVLRHSFLVAQLVPAVLRDAALLHDAAEAYLGDVTSPLKVHLPHFMELEHAFLATIHEALGVEPPGPDEHQLIRAADARAFKVEARLVGPRGLWQTLGAPCDAEAEELLRQVLRSRLRELRARFVRQLQRSR